MKKYFILFICLFILSCSKEKLQSSSILCPEVFFSKNHNVYISTEENSITLDNISYWAEINNYNFDKDCSINNNKIKGKLSILFIVKLDKAKKSDITIPYYIALLDHQKTIIDIQYYKVEDKLNMSTDKSFYIETEVTISNNITFSNFQDKYPEYNHKLLIGFMLSDKKLNILN